MSWRDHTYPMVGGPLDGERRLCRTSGLCVIVGKDRYALYHLIERRLVFQKIAKGDELEKVNGQGSGQG